MLKERCFVNDFFIKHIRIFTRRDHLILLDITYNFNVLQWKLFTIMIRFEYDQ